MRENFVELLSPLLDKDVWSDEDRENIDRYLGNCAEYRAMRDVLARLESIAPYLREDEEQGALVTSRVNEFTNAMRKYKTRAARAAHNIALSDIEAQPARRRAFEYFNRFELETAEFFAGLSDSRFAELGGLSFNAVDFADTEQEWDKFIEGVRVEPPDRWMMKEFFKDLSVKLFEAAYEAHGKMVEAAPPDVVAKETARRYYRASIAARPFLQNMTTYAFFLQNDRRFLEAADKYRETLEMFEGEMTDEDRLAILDPLGMIEVDNDLNRRARKTLFATVELARKLLPTDSQRHRPTLGKALNRLGRTLFGLREDAEAKDYLLEALEINRALMKTDPLNFESQVMEGLGDLAYLESRERNFDAVEKYFLEAIELARKLSAEEEYFKQRLGFYLTAMALAHEEMLDIAAAERGHNEGWEIFHGLASAEPARFGKDLAQRSVIRADFYQRYLTEKRETSIWDAADACALAAAFPEDEMAVSIAFRAKGILEKWELDSEEIAHHISFQEAARSEMLKKIKIVISD
jgi:hypothetical protein